ncbi:hypothetical protein ALC56_06028 [Trachymyrmex septentrionalis]|uniref:Uncharacterized protein n=1 Tax=Trachymyrmex septentrionalis TaxID=34720 RepID=A0A195FFQ7_9HYME|nr:hypothetical protein ALC56_06028 [Trachymyrmex septentrionalis]
MVKRMSRDAVALIVLSNKFEKYLKFNHELSEKLHAFAPQSKDYLKLVSGNTIRAFSPPESIFPVSVNRLLIFDKVNKFFGNALALCHVVTPSRIIGENADLQKSRGLKLVMVHVSKNILLTQQVIDVVYNDGCSVGIVQHRTLTISFDEINPFRFLFEFPLDYVKRSYRAFHSDAPGAPITLPFGGRNKHEGGINHREVRARGMHYAHYLERISIVEPESIGRNNAIETYQEGGTLQIAQIQTVRQVPTDNLAYPGVFGTIGRRE